jgi:hypothetical protein
VCMPDDGHTAKSIDTDKFDDLLKRWERFRDASQYENQRMHDRFNWLMISQPILFTALAFAVKERKDCPLQASGLTGSALSALMDECKQLGFVLGQVEFLTIGLGLSISSLALVGLAAAGRKHWQWTTRLNALASKLNDDKENEPTVPFGLEPHWPARTTSLVAPTIASTFVFAWLCLTLTLADCSMRWLIFSVDAMLLLFVVLFIQAARWLHRCSARKKAS